jgi:tetratricopeptide (TPR) repeat protein
MALSEIEKLERRYAENPQGLTFAPLAEVHRKNGAVQRALDLLTAGLEHHPDYIPASIVLGRCHLDLGDVHAAEKAFLHVHELDGENVIALKALADISERLLKFEDAERWLRTLLSVDRSNDEARDQLQRVEVARRQAGVASSAEPASAVEPVSLVGEAVAAPSEAAVAEATPEPTRAFEAPVAEPAVGWVSQSSEISELPSPSIEELEPSALPEPLEEPAGIQFQEPTHYDEEVEPLDGLVGRELDVPDEVAEEFRVETSEDIVLESSGGGEFQVPDASQELFADRSMGKRAPFEEDAPVPPPAAASGPEHEPEPTTAEPTMMDPAQPEPVAAAQAAAPEAAAETPLPTAASASKRPYVASKTGGLPVAQFLKDILSARPPAQAAPAAVRQAQAASGSGAPTRPAADALSLSSVFGEEEAPASPPAVPAAGAGTGVSFDDFFGAPGATPAQRGTRSPDPKNDDLDQFHAWLQNLKR